MPTPETSSRDRLRILRANFGADGGRGDDARRDSRIKRCADCCNSRMRHRPHVMQTSEGETARDLWILPQAGRNKGQLVDGMRTLVACEFSGTVRNAFLARGHDAWSCDLLPTDTPPPMIDI